MANGMVFGQGKRESNKLKSRQKSNDPATMHGYYVITGFNKFFLLYLTDEAHKLINYGRVFVVNQIELYAHCHYGDVI